MKGTGAKRDVCPGSSVSTGAKFPVVPVESVPMRYASGCKWQLCRPFNCTLPPLTLLETSASYSMNTSLFLTRSHLSPNLAVTIFASFAVSVHSLPRYQNSFHHHHFHCSLQGRLLQLSLSQPAQVSITRLQLIQNSLARAVVKAPKSSHITPILRYLHWLKINERIEYNVFKSLLAAPPLDTRPCISRYALGPGFVCRKVTTSAMLTQRSCCLLQRLSAAGPSLGSELAGTLLCVL